MSKNLPHDAICINCDYPLCNLPEQRCPECGRRFDPTDENSFMLRSDRKFKIPFLLGFRLSIAHLGIILVLCIATPALRPACTPPHCPPSLKAVSFIVNILMQPIGILLEKKQGTLEWVLFFTNSLLWGFTVAFVVTYIKQHRAGK